MTLTFKPLGDTLLVKSLGTVIGYIEWRDAWRQWVYLPHVVNDTPLSHTAEELLAIYHKVNSLLPGPKLR